MAYTRPHEDRLAENGSAGRFLSWTGTGVASYVDGTGQFSEEGGDTLRLLSGFITIGAFDGDSGANLDAFFSFSISGDDPEAILSSVANAGTYDGSSQVASRGRELSTDSGTLSLNVSETAADSKHYCTGGHGLVLPILASDPSGGNSEEGQTYANSTTHKVRAYNGTIWQDQLRGYATSIGNGALTTITVTHNLGTLDVMVQLYDNSTGLPVIPLTMTRATTNTVVFTFTVAPGSSAYRVVVQG